MATGSGWSASRHLRLQTLVRAHDQRRLPNLDAELALARGDSAAGGFDGAAQRLDSLVAHRSSACRRPLTGWQAVLGGGLRRIAPFAAVGARAARRTGQRCRRRIGWVGPRRAGWHGLDKHVEIDGARRRAEPIAESHSEALRLTSDSTSERLTAELALAGARFGRCRSDAEGAAGNGHAKHRHGDRVRARLRALVRHRVPPILVVPHARPHGRHSADGDKDGLATAKDAAAVRVERLDHEALHLAHGGLDQAGAGEPVLGDRRRPQRLPLRLGSSLPLGVGFLSCPCSRIHLWLHDLLPPPTVPVRSHAPAAGDGQRRATTGF